MRTARLTRPFWALGCRAPVLLAFPVGAAMKDLAPPSLPALGPRGPTPAPHLHPRGWRPGSRGSLWPGSQGRRGWALGLGSPWQGVWPAAHLAGAAHGSPRPRPVQAPRPGAALCPLPAQQPAPGALGTSSSSSRPLLLPGPHPHSAPAGRRPPPPRPPPGAPAAAAPAARAPPPAPGSPACHRRLMGPSTPPPRRPESDRHPEMERPPAR